jgi:Ni,Fe-hydrogenase III small subunit
MTWLQRTIKSCFKKSLWVYHANAGSCNGCDIEEICAFTPYYDAERFGLRLVASPRHADVLLISGPVTRQVKERLLRLYEAVPDPKLVIGVGSCCAGGGIWYDTYHTEGGLASVLPVDYYIPGCPPRPEAILYGIAVAAGLKPPLLEVDAHAAGAGDRQPELRG